MVEIVSTQPVSATGDVRLRRTTAVAGLLSVGSLAAAV
jgi:hypothetical protein